MDSTADDAVARAIVADAVHKIAELAAACSVSPAAVSAVAAAHGDNCFAQTVDVGMAALESVRGRARAVFAKLRARYASSAMIDTLERADDEPFSDEKNATIAVGGHVFSTSNSVLLVHVWRVLNPGTAIVAMFCDGLGTTQGDLTDPDDFVEFFNAAVPKNALADQVARVEASLKYVDENVP